MEKKNKKCPDCKKYKLKDLEWWRIFNQKPVKHGGKTVCSQCMKKYYGKEGWHIITA
jgi:hypothetical protein